MATIDFAELKERVSIEQVVQMLGLTLKKANAQLRGRCPICNAGDDRGFVVTPAKGVFYCFKESKGGDALSLVSRVRGCTIREAAEAITEHFGNPTVPDKRETNSSSRQDRRGFDVEAYAKALDPAHEALKPLGMAPETLREWKAGYSNSGVLRGRLALPITGKDGTIIGYMGRAVKDESPTLTFPNGVTPSEHIFGADRVGEGELYLVRDPLDVLKAAEGGIENAVCFLCEITPQMLEMLASLMDERKAATVTLF